MPPDPHVHVGVGAVVHGPSHLSASVLLIRRGGAGAFQGDGNGTWCLPGGWLDFGETPQEAAVRECLEETGVTATAIGDAGWVCCESYNGEEQIVTLFIRCAYVEGTPHVTEPDKCPEVLWLPRSELSGRELFRPLAIWHEQGNV